MKNSKKQANGSCPSFTKTETIVLKELLKNARASDTAIAKKIGVTPPAVLKIRRKLEAEGLIRGYIPDVDFGKLGISVMTVHFVKILPAAWEELGEAELSKRIQAVPNIIFASRVMDPSVSYVFICAFSDMNQLTDNVLKAETILSRYFCIERMLVFSGNNVVKFSYGPLVANILDGNGLDVDQLLSSKTA
jgi:DNA-binding Lrp family transcriptional regulator